VDRAIGADAHVRNIIAIHFDPDGGSPFWLERQRELGIDARRSIRELADLDLLGPMDQDALRDRPVLDFVPSSRRDRLVGAIIAETGGTTGRPKRTIYTRDEFHAAFVEPFVRVATATGFPRGALWLWAGPSGPHVIGRAAASCATAMGSPRPFSLDFDPRWFRRMPADSMARDRYLAHLIEQAMFTIEREPIGTIFTTPVLLARLAEAMTRDQRERIRGVHYGGMRLTRELLEPAQRDWFPRAVHLSGYGNSLFGVCMEFGGPSDRTLRYYPFGPRLHAAIDDDGHVRMSRLDETVLIANLRERDVAVAVSVPLDNACNGFGLGIEDPHPPDTESVSADIGIY
jgi:hypothetical protein